MKKLLLSSGSALLFFMIAGASHASCYLAKTKIPVNDGEQEVYVRVLWNETDKTERVLRVYDLNGKIIAASNLNSCGDRPPYRCGLADEGASIGLSFYSEPPTDKHADGTDHAILSFGEGNALKVSHAPDSNEESYVFLSGGREPGMKPLTLTKTTSLKYCPQRPRRRKIVPPVKPAPPRTRPKATTPVEAPNAIK